MASTVCLVVATLCDEGLSFAITNLSLEMTLLVVPTQTQQSGYIALRNLQPQHLLQAQFPLYVG